METRGTILKLEPGASSIRPPMSMESLGLGSRSVKRNISFFVQKWLFANKNALHNLSFSLFVY